MASEASETNKWIDAVARLLALTQERKLIWRVAGYSSDEDQTPFYETEYRGKALRLKWSTLYLVDSETGVAWPFPSTEVVSHLKDAVKYQVVGVGDFLDELLTQGV
jgi:hypothetical protein